MTLDLDDTEAEALARVLRNAIDDDRFPLSPRVQLLQRILGKIRPQPVRPSLPPSQHYAPPRASARQRRK